MKIFIAEKIDQRLAKKSEENKADPQIKKLKKTRKKIMEDYLPRMQKYEQQRKSDNGYKSQVRVYECLNLFRLSSPGSLCKIGERICEQENLHQSEAEQV